MVAEIKPFAAEDLSSQTTIKKAVADRLHDLNAIDQPLPWERFITTTSWSETLSTLQLTRYDIQSIKAWWEMTYAIYYLSH